MNFLVLGAGLQGTACAADLLADPAVTSVTLADLRVDPLPAFLAPHLAGGRLRLSPLDVRDEAAVRAAMAGVEAVCSAIPYYFNLPLARLAVAAGRHFTDLGGNTAIVQQQRALDAEARARGVSVVPDTGLAPGMVNVIAQHGIDQFATVESVRLYVGGLPQVPEPPLGYQVAYSIEGMVDYYTTPSLVLRDGVPTEVAALSERVAVPFAAPLGELEAFHTAGGLSTMVYRYAGRIPVMEYKTLRYPGHATIMAAIRDLGLLDTDPVAFPEGTVSPRALFVRVAGERLRKGKPDLVALRVEVTGRTADGARQCRTWEVVDRADEARGVTAMMRTTGYTLAITGLLQRTGVIPPGVHTPDEGIPPQRYFDALAARGITVAAPPAVTLPG
jgi:lysine 6-dehydrogenase